MQDNHHNRIPNIQIPLCLIHNQLGQVINPDKNDKKRPVLCIDCLTKHKKVEDQINENKKIISDIQNENNRKIEILNNFQSQVNEFLNEFTNNLKKIIQMISDQIDIIILKQEGENQFLNQSNLIDIDEILQINDIQNSFFKEFNEYIHEQLQNIKKNLSIDYLIDNMQQYEQIQNKVDVKKKYQYSQLIHSIQQNEFCSAIAINSTNSILAFGECQSIKIYEFQNEKLNQIQEIDDHIYEVQCLNFMRKSPHLISANYGGQIIIWEQNKNKNQWSQIQNLSEHQNRICCLEVNQNEDMIISGSDDATIKFWKLDQKLWRYDQTLQMEDTLISLSLNQSNSKLITSIRNKMYVKLFQKNGNQWNCTQTIQLSKNISRLCFIDDNQFALQLLESDRFQIFNFNQKDGQFKSGQEIKIKFGKEDCILFPMKYVKSKELLIGKFCCDINILRKQQNGEFSLDQIIELGHKSLYGCVSDDGQFLFTWDQSSKEIQVRKLDLI